MGEKVEDFLAHYGVLGMKWGRRKANGTSAVPGLNRRTQTSEDFRNTRALKRNAKPTLSNKELKEVVDRLALEKRYSDLTKRQSSIGRGQAIVAGILAAGVTANGIINLAQSPVGKKAADTFRKSNLGRRIVLEMLKRKVRGQQFKMVVRKED